MKNGFLLLMLLFLTLNIFSESLWQNSEGSLFTGASKDYRVGDIVTILVSESQNATSRGQSSVQKNNSLSLSAGSWTGLPLSDLGGAVQNSSGFAGQGTTTRSGSLTAKITAKVADILPNGNLILNGERKLQINEETEILKISGTVRPIDITIDNTIQSQYLADAKIVYTGRGDVHTSERQGAISKFFMWLF